MGRTTWIAIRHRAGHRARRPETTHEILGGKGVKLHVREWGNPGGPVLLFIHGWSQSDLCWMNQVCGELTGTFRIVTFDLRGHGLSEKPLGPEHYADGQLWADDVASVIDQTGLEKPILVAWSYGGYIVADYLRAYGDSRIGAINLVGAAILLRPPAFDHIGPGLLENVQGMCAPGRREHRRNSAFSAGMHLQAARRR